MTTGSATRDHGDPGDAPTVPPPLTAPANTARPSAAEEARTIAASTNSGTLATLTADGDLDWMSGGREAREGTPITTKKAKGKGRK